MLMIPQGKGYADLATLEFLSLVHSARPPMPILGVVDCDPHGIEIMRTYKYGSQRLSHEENARVPGLQWLGVKMDNILGASRPVTEEDGSQSSFASSSQSSQSSLGQFSQGSQGSLLGKEILTQRAWRLHTDQFCAAGSQPNRRHRARGPRNAADSVMPLTTNDRKTAQRTFGAMTARGGELDHEETEQLREIQVMLMLNVKAEIQAIDNMGDLSDWLDDKIGLA